MICITNNVQPANFKNTIKPSQVSKQLKKKQLTHKKYNDQGSRSLSELKSKDSVHMQAGNR